MTKKKLSKSGGGAENQLATTQETGESKLCSKVSGSKSKPAKTTDAPRPRSKLTVDGVMHKKPNTSVIGTTEAACAAMSQPAKNAFRVHAHLEIPVASEVVLEAESPEEAMKLAQSVLKGDSITGHLHSLIDARTVSVPAQRNEQVEVRLESVFSDVPINVCVWKIVALASGDSYQPVFKILPNESSKMTTEDGSTTAAPDEQAG